MVTRRSALGALGAGALVAASGLPAFSRSPSPPGKAKRLQPGDTVGLVAPAGFIGDRFGVEQIEEAVRAMGLEPRAAPNLVDRAGYLAGSDRERASAFQAMFEDDAIDGIFAVRGGWGCARILPHLDFAAIARNPKVFMGSSDITALHLAFAARAGFATLHSPNAASSWPLPVWEQFRALAFEGATPTLSVPGPRNDRLTQGDWRIRTFRPGTARGRLLGGNLTVLSALVGTPYLPDFAGAILFLEDTNEAEYRIDRMLTQLSLAGILGKVAGVVFGQCTNCTNPGDGFGNYTIYQVLEQHLAPLGVPAFQGAMIGHISAQTTVPVGCLGEIDAEAGTIRVLEPAVR